MKIRIKGPSIRLRLSQTDVRTFAATGQCAEETPLPGGPLRYALLRGAGYAADFDGRTVSVTVPEAEGERWARSEEVGLACTLTLADGTELALLVEKDFACLSPNRDEDESDLFPNPNPHC